MEEVGVEFRFEDESWDYPCTIFKVTSTHIYFRWETGGGYVGGESDMHRQAYRNYVSCGHYEWRYSKKMLLKKYKECLK